LFEKNIKYYNKLLKEMEKYLTFDELDLIHKTTSEAILMRKFCQTSMGFEEIHKLVKNTLLTILNSVADIL
jgi:hypothetical protein